MEVPPTDSLKLLTYYAKVLRELEIEHGKRALEMQELSKKINELKQETLPNLFHELNLKRLDLETGEVYTVEQFYAPRIKNMEAFYSWLKEQDEAAIVKEAVSVRFEPDDRLIEMVTDFLEVKGLPFEHKKDIHPATLKKYIKEKIEAGASLPESIEVYMGTTIKVKKS